ncbi:MAG: L-histidine N(alpha)-methyltransferase [Cyclobacteriaceae bacterium]
MNISTDKIINDTIISDDIPDVKFAEDVLLGLSSRPKYLSSKYFYNKKGDEIFQQIMHMPEYYPTDCELDIFKKYKQQMLQYFTGSREFFDLIEFGAGDGMKTKILLSHFLTQNASFKYLPIDISANILQTLNDDLQTNLPQLQVQTMQGDYFETLASLNLVDDRKKVVLFLGSNIGNFSPTGTVDFLHQLHKNLTKGDMLLIGFDLKKDPSVILKAYNDPHGITKAFNLNLLQRINDELEANFDLNTFRHYPYYDPVSGESRSYLISEIEQYVDVKSLNTTFHFHAWEPIHTEISKKFDLHFIQSLASKTGFKLAENFFDENKYYVNSLWKKM